MPKKEYRLLNITPPISMNFACGISKEIVVLAELLKNDWKSLWGGKV